MITIDQRINLFFSLFFVMIGFSSFSLSLENNFIITVQLGILLFILFYILGINYFKFEKQSSLLYFISIFFLLFVSCLISPYSYDYMWFRYFGVVFCILFGVVGYFLNKNNNFNLFFISNVFSIIGFFHCLFLIFLWLKLEDPRNYDWVVDIPFFSNIRHLADYLSICFLMAFQLLLKDDRKLKYVYYIVALVILSVIIWTGSRAAFVSIISALILLFLYKKGILKKLFLVLIPALFVQPFFITNSPSLGLVRSVERVGQSLDSYSSGRMGLYNDVVEKIIDYPIWGLGPEAVRNSGINNGTFVFAQAHNFVLQILIEFGLAGFLLFLLIFFRFFLKIKKIKNSYISLFLAMICLNIIVAATFNGGFYYIITLHLFCFFFGALLANLDSKSTITIS